jgi:hypothetical protein
MPKWKFQKTSGHKQGVWVATGIKSFRQAGTSSDRWGFAQTGGPCSNRQGPCSDRRGLVQCQRAMDLFDNKVIVTCIEDCSPNQFRTQATKALFDLGPAQSSSRGQLKTPAYRGKLFFAVAIQSIVVIKTE